MKTVCRLPFAGFGNGNFSDMGMQRFSYNNKAYRLKLKSLLWKCLRNILVGRALDLNPTNILSAVAGLKSFMNLF